MAQVSVVGPDGGESIQLGPTRMRILEDGSTTGHRLGMGRSPWPRTPTGRSSTGTPGTTKASSPSSGGRSPLR